MGTTEDTAAVKRAAPLRKYNIKNWACKGLGTKRYDDLAMGLRRNDDFAAGTIDVDKYDSAVFHAS